MAFLCAVMVGCGGGDSGGGGSASPGSGGGTSVVEPPAPTGSEPPTEGRPVDPVTPASPEPEATAPWNLAELAMAKASPPARWFYDVAESGNARVLRNDLAGGLSAEIQFVQNHSVAPAGNALREMPTTVALREALLLFISKDLPVDLDPVNDVLSVTATRQGTALGTIRMRPPVLLPRSDSSTGGDDGRGDVGYSRYAWSASLPWEWMRPGLQLGFVFKAAGGDSKSGTLASSAIEFASPDELVIQNIRLGMLTAPNTDTGYLMSNPEKAGSDYFQTIPVARLTVARYDDVQLDRVIVSTGGGAIYTTGSPSPQQGGVYDGDMRQDVAKIQVAQGINLANFGITDSLMNEDQPESYSQRVAHHARGLYANGVQEHGLSGGNGVITLSDSIGNEFSHEMGHSYGLGHYPGASDNVKNPVHHADSGWGYIGWRQRMRGNLVWGGSFQSTGTVDYLGNFAGVFNYNADAMSGGYPDSAFSQYTHHTGYSARRIQSYLNTGREGGPRAVPDTAYASGWRGWDSAAGQWVDRATLAPAFTAPRPIAVGVPVVTLLGGYQTTDAALNLIYPAFHGNWGVVYGAPAAPPSTGAACWLEVGFEDASSMQVALTPSGVSEPPRKFHLNIAESRRPSTAAILCRNAGNQVSTLAQQAIASRSSPMQAATVIGEERGFSELRALEVRQIDALLAASAADSALNFDQEQTLLAWRAQLDGLSTSSRQKAEQWLALRDKSLFVNAHALVNPALGVSRTQGDAVDALKRLAGDMALLDGDGKLLAPASAKLTLLGDGSCLAMANADQASSGLVRQSSGACSGTDAQRWWLDGTGRIHNAARPDLCLKTDGGWYTPITLAQCALQSRGQAFVQRSSGRLEAVNFGNRSIEAASPAHIMNNDESSSKAWSTLPRTEGAAWALLSAEAYLALWQQLGP